MWYTCTEYEARRPVVDRLALREGVQRASERYGIAGRRGRAEAQQRDPSVRDDVQCDQPEGTTCTPSAQDLFGSFR